MEKSNFHQFFGDYPIIRILDFLLENEGFDYSKTDISREAQVSIGSLYKVWDRLEELDIVEKSRQYGPVILYRINSENELVKKLKEFDFKLNEYYADKILSKEPIPQSAP